MEFLRFVKALLGSVFVLVSISFVNPSELIGGTILLLNLLLIDRLACGVLPRFDDNCFVASIVVAFFGTNLRAAGIPPTADSGGARDALLQLAWAGVGLLLTVNAKRPVDPHTPAWVPVFLSAGSGLCALSTYAPAETFVQFAVRSCLYLGLTLSLYVGREFGEGSLIRGRGFLLCFYPVMFLGWALAVMFALVSLLALLRMDYDDVVAARAQAEAGAYRLVQVAPSDII